MKKEIKLGWKCILACIAGFVSTLLLWLYNAYDIVYPWKNYIFTCCVIFCLISLFSYFYNLNDQANGSYYVFKDKYNTFYTTNDYRIIEGKYYVEGYVSQTNELTGNNEFVKSFIEVEHVKDVKYGGITLSTVLMIVFVMFSIINSLY